MYGPTRAKNDYLKLTNTVRIFVLIRQEDKESLAGYSKRFKQLKDNFQTMVDMDLLDHFVGSTEEYQNGNSNKKIAFKAAAFIRWATCLYINSSDNKKYRQLKITYKNNMH